MQHLTQERICSLLQYDPITGILIWKTRIGVKKTWNTRYAGKTAGYVTEHGYIEVGIDGKRYYAHRLIWLLVHGFMPEMMDHINHVRCDNRLCNLREATPTDNQRNKSLGMNNTSGACGVSFSARDNLWYAKIKVAGNDKYLGCYKAKHDAVAARKHAEVYYGFHTNHGII